MFATFAVGSCEGKVAYCIEPGTPIDNGHTFTAKDETFWDNYPSVLNKTIDADTIKSLIGRILQDGYNGNIDPTWVSQNSAAADKLAHVYATQLLIWETIVGERDENFGHVSTGGKNPVLDFIKQGHPLRSRIMEKYNSMVTSVQNHSKVPSFMAKSRGKAPTIELEWDGSQYTAKLTDDNKVLGNYNFTSDYTAMKFTTSGNVLTITSPTDPTGDVTVSASKKDSKRMGLVVWDDGTFGPGVGQQNIVTYTQSVTDPIAAYLKLNVSYGSAKIVKTSEDGKVEGITFKITGNGIDQNVTTNSRGEVQIDNLQPGEYTVTEQMAGDYVPLEPQKVTVQAGQTATVSFNNSLQKGSLTVAKNSEDGLNIELYPKTYENYILEKSAIAEDYDETIAKLCFAQAVKFIECHSDDDNPEIQAQIIVLKYMLFRFMNNDTRGYIYTNELKNQLSNTTFNEISTATFRMRIIGKLRDKGVIIASSSKGYKLPSKLSELYDFINRDASIVIPMLARLKKCRDLVKLGTANNLDLLDHTEYQSLKAYFDNLPISNIGE